MNHWYENMTAINIRDMKNNVHSLRMLRYIGSKLANLFEYVPLEELIYLERKCDTDKIMWGEVKIPLDVADGMIYRLRPEWEPKPRILPCPNCGNSDVVSEVCDRPMHLYQRRCGKCGLGMASSDSQEDADRKWNAMAKKLTKGEEQ